MSGYTTRFSVGTIKHWLDKNYFDDSNSKMDITQALNDLDVHFRHDNISEIEYENLRRELERKVAKKEH